jgi:hypothetical protein
LSNRKRRCFRPIVELLESRLTPSGNVTTSVVAGSLTITGDAQANGITISQTAAHQITITPDATTSINNLTAGTPVTLNNITHSLTINLGAGNDNLTFNEAAGNITINGNLNINGTTGNKTVLTTTGGTANTLAVTGSFNESFGNGTELSVVDQFSVGGNMTFDHANGAATVVLGVDPANLGKIFNSVGGNLNVLNTNPNGTAGTGNDFNALEETSVAGNVDVIMGFGNNNTTAENWTSFGTEAGGSNLVTVGGNVLITSLTGSLTLGDFFGFGEEVVNTSVKGSVTMNLGSGSGSTAVFGAGTGSTATPTAGSVTIVGSGANQGAVVSAANIKNNMNVSLSGGGVDTVALAALTVARNTSITTGPGADSVTIDDSGATGSTFGGTVTINTGGGADTLAINSGTGTGKTTFQGNVSANLGAGNDTLSLATSGKVAFLGSATFDGDGGTNTANVNPGNLPNHKPTLENFV